MKTSFFIPAQAHEGCVWRPDSGRLYFSTTKHLPKLDVRIAYLDLSRFNLAEVTDWFTALYRSDLESTPTETLVEDANMANSFCFSPPNHLLVCEQGTQDTPARVNQVSLDNGQRTVLLDNIGGEPLNSPNKILRSRNGHLVISDPDYGFRQGFRPPPVLEPSLYVVSADDRSSPLPFRCNLEMPHGLALTPDERRLFVTDTSADGAHDNVDLPRRRGVYQFDFDAASGQISGQGRHCFDVAEGVPDGMETTTDRLLVGGGDGVYVADLDGRLLGKIPTEHTSVNLALAGPDDRHLFVTADAGVYLFLEWRDWVA